MSRKVINIYGKRIVVDHIHSYYHSSEDNEITVFCLDQAYNFPYTGKLMSILDSLFDMYTPNVQA